MRPVSSRYPDICSGSLRLNGELVLNPGKHRLTIRVHGVDTDRPYRRPGWENTLPLIRHVAFQRRDGPRQRLAPVELPDIFMETTEQYPYVLITGRLLEHFNTGEMSRRSAKLSKLRPASHLKMNPADEQADRLMENGTVRITSPHGSVQLTLNTDASIQRGSHFFYYQVGKTSTGQNFF